MMRISKLIIKNFRIFRGVYQFNLDKDLIIIQGQNGNGKSTIFDAIEWCITGELKRYKGSHERSKFNYIFNEKEYGKSNAEVRIDLYFKDNKNECHISRRMNKDSQRITTVIVDGAELNERDGNKRIQTLLMNYTNADELPVDIKTNFREYFCATQLLSQSEIANFVTSSKPQSRFEVMENILGLNRYGNSFNEHLKSIQNRVDNIIDLDKQSKDKVVSQVVEVEKELIEINTNIENMQKHYEAIGDTTELRIITEIKDYINSVNSFFSELFDDANNVNEISSDLVKLLKVKKEKLNDIYANIQKDISILISLSPEIEVKVNDIKSNIFTHNVEIKRVEQDISRDLGKADKCEKIEYQLENLKQSQEVYKKKYEKIRNLEDRINSLKTQREGLFNSEPVKTIIIKYKDISSFMEEYKRTLISQEGYSSYKSYFDLLSQLASAESQLKKLYGDLGSSKTELNEISEQKQHTDNNIQEIEASIDKSQNDSVKELVYSIQKLLHDEGTHKFCPVCGTDFKNQLNLQNAIKILWEKNSETLSELEKQKYEYSIEKKQCEEKIAELTSKIDKINRNCKEKQNEINRLKVEVEKKLVTVDTNLAIYSIEKIDEEQEKCIKLINDYGVAFEISQSICAIDSDINYMVESLSNDYKELQDIIELSGKSAKYINKSETYIVNKLKSFSKFKITFQQKVNLHRQKKEQLIREIADLENKISKWESAIDGITKILPNFSGSKEELEREISLLNGKLNKIKILEKDLENILKSVNAYLTKDELVTLKYKKNEKQSKLDELKIKQEKYRIKISTLYEYKNEIDTLKVESGNLHSELMGRFMRDYNDIIDRLFFQISPHAFARHVHLIPNEKNLYIILSDNNDKREDYFELKNEELEKKVNASLTLSSAQSNVLAVCIFIALNMAQKYTNVELLGIDDPFQNMDDINAFSFVDTISTILKNKQVIISTHNEDFAALIQNKSSLTQEKIGHIKLSSYNEEEVEITSSLLIK